MVVDAVQRQQFERMNAHATSLWSDRDAHAAQLLEFVETLLRRAVKIHTGSKDMVPSEARFGNCCGRARPPWTKAMLVPDPASCNSDRFSIEPRVCSTVSFTPCRAKICR